jgi:hypothetical protein
MAKIKTSVPFGEINLPFGGIGVGNIYYVINTTEAHYAQFCADYNVVYSDGSESVCPDDGEGGNATGIHAALTKTVAGRNDYVIVMPGDYNSYYAYLMTKSAVHLIAPAGFGYDIGANNSTCLFCNSGDTEDAVIKISARACEVAGFRMSSFPDESAILLTATALSPNIHHNTIALNWGAGTIKAAILGETAGGSWGKIERNLLWSTYGNARTCAAVILIAANATGCQVNHNEIVIGDTNIATIGISNLAVKGATNFNIFSESGGSGAANGGTITKCVTISASGCAMGNLGAVATGQLLAGGTTGHSFVGNVAGTVTSGTDHWNPEA